MMVFDVPPQALEERGCFSVVSRCGAEELLFLPPGTVTDSAASEACWLHFLRPAAEYARLPITPRTLVSEAAAAQFPQNPVFVSDQLCGGTLRVRLEQALTDFGARLWLLCEPVCARLPLPCRDAQEQVLGMADLMAKRSLGRAFYADAFCCNCLPAPEESAVYLYDTAETLQKKCALAEDLGIGHAVVFPVQA